MTMNRVKSVLANANKLKRQGKLNQAIRQYYHAIQLNDKFSWSYYYLAETLAEYGNTDEAIHAYKLAIELHPKQPWFHHALGELHHTRRELQQATICFHTAIDLDHDFYFSRQKLQETLDQKEKEVDYQESQDIKHRKLLIVGNPRCGSGYMHKIFQECGFRIGHEKDMQDGISCWFFAVSSKTSPGGNEVNPGLSRNHFYFEKTVHHVRDPKTAIPSTLMLIDNRYARRGEKVAMNYIYKHIKNHLNVDVENMEQNLDRAIASFVYWNKIIESTIVRSAVFKVENCEIDVINFIKMNNLIDLKNHEKVKSNIFQPELKKYNNSLNKFKKPKPIIDDSMWMKVDEQLKKELNIFCDKYGYERIF